MWKKAIQTLSEKSGYTVHWELASDGNSSSHVFLGWNKYIFFCLPFLALSPLLSLTSSSSWIWCALQNQHLYSTHWGLATRVSTLYRLPYLNIMVTFWGENWGIDSWITKLGISDRFLTINLFDVLPFFPLSTASSLEPRVYLEHSRYSIYI